MPSLLMCCIYAVNESAAVSESVTCEKKCLCDYLFPSFYAYLAE